jgi:hypothetical protein
MATNENAGTSDAELWKSIPFDEQVWIDMAVDRGDKVEATKRCLCHGRGFTMVSAKRLVDQRLVELAKRRIPKSE